MTTSRPRKEGDGGRFSFEGLERLFHERARLAILTSLASRPEGVVFSDLKGLCSLTDGNLARHLQALREAGVVEVRKWANGRRPRTVCRLSAVGRRRFLRYLDTLEGVVREALDASKRTVADRTAGPDAGWSPA